ncbi:Uncharacterized membrane protein, DUF485 family [Magnetospirillum fulvum]|uniref:Uncharacterized membrane protein, DUF485 family n=2 Tax=Magnetospirillum fulvum TaxID=1082 RepID=A0A1H6HNA2_MAGFU|nr:Uncharacterized membrane protein, DUF485 family [Magnetospirillum fulvum]
MIAATMMARRIVEGKLSNTAQNLASAEKIRNNPKFRELVSKRTRFAWTLSAIVLVMYFGFIALIAFNKALLATPLGVGINTTVGFPLGVGVILTAVILTGIYVYRANGEFDELNRQIIEESR